MTQVKGIINSRYSFWVLLALPSVPMIFWSVIDPHHMHDYMHDAGDYAAHFLVLALIITPLMYLTNGIGFIRWLRKRRRYIGVAAFSYTALHVAFDFLQFHSFEAFWSDTTRLSIIAGWVAFFILIPLAITSNQWAVRTLGRAWKSLHRWVYVAALFTLAHWILIEHGYVSLTIHFGLLAALEGYRVWYRSWGGRRTVKA